MDADAARVAIDGVPLPVDPAVVYYLLDKPVGVVSSTSDPQRRPVVTDLVPDDVRVYPVGRLDADSEGLLLLTNDGVLTNLVTHPRHGITKRYLARVTGVPDGSSLSALVAGVRLDDGAAKAISARLVDRHGEEALVEVVMAEGRKREVRRMLEAIGHPVQRLVRTAIGPVTDQRLRAGEWRSLTVEEVRALYSAADSPWEDAPAASYEEE